MEAEAPASCRWHLGFVGSSAWRADVIVQALRGADAVAREVSHVGEKV